MKISPGASAWLHRYSAALKPVVASVRLGAYRRGFDRWPIRIRHWPGSFRRGMTIEKDARGGLVVATDRRKLATDKNWFSTLWKRAGVFVDLISDPRVGPGIYVCDLSDSCEQPGPVLTFCSNIAENILVPDRGFSFKGGYAQARRQARLAPSWPSRDETVLWRGYPSGFGAAIAPTMLADDPELLQRTRMCLVARDIPGTDIKFAIGRHFPAEWAEAYRAAGIAGERIEAVRWGAHKFAVDIDGHANAFSNLYVRMLLGCCVLKVTSPLGFRQWYYDRLLPWTHYVPISADLQDLPDKIAWCRANDDVCCAIAASGQRLAFSMTVETERALTVARIKSALTPS